MTIHQHRASVTAASGSVTSTTLSVKGGLCRQLIARAATATTLFQLDITDSNSVIVARYGYHRGEIMDMGNIGILPIPMAGTYNLNITNSSADEVFTILLGVEE